MSNLNALTLCTLPRKETRNILCGDPHAVPYKSPRMRKEDNSETCP